MKDGTRVDDDVYVSIGEFLGILPYSTNAGVENVSTHMIGGRLIRLDPAATELLAFCRSVRTAEELVEWVADQNTVTDADLARLVDDGLLRHGSAAQASTWLGDRSLVPAGHSAGVVDNALCVVAPSGSAYRVEGSYYWLWLYARTGRTIDSLRSFLTDQAHVDDVGEKTMSTAILHMLIHGLGQIDSPGP